jgi:hypothetical protein
MVTHMKTTLELPDDLFQQAKTVALQRKVTLKHLVEHALRRELNPGNTLSEPAGYRLDEDGLPVLTSCRERVTAEDVYRLQQATELPGDVG